MTAVTKMSAFIIKNWIKIILNLIHLFPDRGQIHKKIDLKFCVSFQAQMLTESHCDFGAWSQAL